ncbi:MAG: hypothetical protein QOD83_5070 [Solirubrobacteraceae bacterium]|jgi:hypothetical protein|nr:hypothetical protein [Solirubrobacteraceae bacterium]
MRITVVGKGNVGAVWAGPIENAAAQEALVKIVFAIGEGLGPFVYRMAPIEEL